MIATCARLLSDSLLSNTTCDKGIINRQHGQANTVIANSLSQIHKCGNDQARTCVKNERCREHLSPSIRDFSSIILVLRVAPRPCIPSWAHGLAAGAQDTWQRTDPSHGEPVLKRSKNSQSEAPRLGKKTARQPRECSSKKGRLSISVFSF
eukprot:4346168-Amphidinium_carterae.1